MEKFVNAKGSSVSWCQRMPPLCRSKGLRTHYLTSGHSVRWCSTMMRFCILILKTFKVLSTCSVFQISGLAISPTQRRSMEKPLASLRGSWFAPHWLWCLWGGTAQCESSRRRSETWPSWGQRWMWPLVLRRVNRFQTASHWQWYIWTTSMRLPSWSVSRMNWVKKGRWQRITVGSSKFVTQKDYPGIWENNWSGPCQERCKEENLMGTEVPSKLAMTSLKALWKWLWGCWQVHDGRSLAYDIGRARLPSAVLSGECCLPSWVRFFLRSRSRQLVMYRHMPRLLMKCYVSWLRRCRPNLIFGALWVRWSAALMRRLQVVLRPSLPGLKAAWWRSRPAMCSVACCFAHQEHSCPRSDFWTPLFHERFSGRNYPLTKACALAGIGVQPPLDREVEGLPWEFFGCEGKKTLDNYETSPALAASHWAPECKTFSAARGKPIQLSSGRWTQGPKALRSADQPWGLKNLGKNDQIKARQGNSMAKRAIQGCKEAFLARRFASLEHPWGSHLWKTDEALELCNVVGTYVSCYSHCCFGGRREKWQCLVHNCPQLHHALHKPHCEGHRELLRYQVHERADGTLAFDTEDEAEYPWQWCVVYSRALRQALREKCPAPVGLRDLTLQNAIFSALKCSTRGMQNDAVARETSEEVYSVVSQMTPGHELEHLKWLLRKVSTRGCDIKLLTCKEDGTESFMCPYPGFMWVWKTILSYKWKEEQHINVLEVSAFLVELRRRTRGPHSTGFRFINVTDSQVMFHVLTKGRSSSPRLNRLARRIAAVSLVGQVYAFHVWTISKWNFADHGSRRFQAIWYAAATTPEKCRH